MGLLKFNFVSTARWHSEAFRRLLLLLPFVTCSEGNNTKVGMELKERERGLRKICVSTMLFESKGGGCSAPSGCIILHCIAGNTHAFSLTLRHSSLAESCLADQRGGKEFFNHFNLSSAEKDLSARLRYKLHLKRMLSSKRHLGVTNE